MTIDPVARTDMVLPRNDRRSAPPSAAKDRLGDTLHGKTVFMIEDEPLLAYLLRENLEAEGASVMATRTCEEAVPTLQRQTPDLAILDFHFHDLKCEPVAKLLQARGVPYIATSADLWTDDFGAVARLNKPYLAEDVIRAARQALAVCVRRPPREQRSVNQKGFAGGACRTPRRRSP